MRCGPKTWRRLVAELRLVGCGRDGKTASSQQPAATAQMANTRAARRSMLAQKYEACPSFAPFSLTPFRRALAIRHPSAAPRAFRASPFSCDKLVGERHDDDSQGGASFPCRCVVFRRSAAIGPRPRGWLESSARSPNASGGVMPVVTVTVTGTGPAAAARRGDDETCARISSRTSRSGHLHCDFELQAFPRKAARQRISDRPPALPTAPVDHRSAVGANEPKR